VTLQNRKENTVSHNLKADETLSSQVQSRIQAMGFREQEQVVFQRRKGASLITYMMSDTIGGPGSVVAMDTLAAG
jgi:hypothetical protein